MYMRGTPASVLRCIRMLEVDRDGSAVKLTGCEVTNWPQQYPVVIGGKQCIA